MPPDGLPPLDLPLILVRDAAAHIIPTIPLEPAARIVFVYPALFLPYIKRLTGIDPEEVQFRVMAQRTQFCLGEPVRRKFRCAVGHVFPSEYAKREHLLRAQLWLELGVKILSHGFHELIRIASLHPVIDSYLFCHIDWKKYTRNRASVILSPISRVDLTFEDPHVLILQPLQALHSDVSAFDVC